MDSKKFTTQSSQETYELGQRLGKKIKQPTIICLYGELGSGKTTFVQGLARGLGIKKRIISPTFTFIRQYGLKIRTDKISTFYHIDLYRLKTLNDIKTLGIEEILSDKKAIIAIEWAEKIKEILPKGKINIYFRYLDKDEREIEINS